MYRGEDRCSTCGRYDEEPHEFDCPAAVVSEKADESGD